MADLTVRQNAQQFETWFPDAEKHRPLPDPGGHAAKVQNSSLGVGEPPVPPGLRLLPILPHIVPVPVSDSGYPFCRLGSRAAIVGGKGC